jgi:oxygen-independent coproporphyrinogen-3 oxidase
VTAKVDSLRRSGLARIAMDLIYGLPRQTAETISRTARAVAALAPDRVSLFGYAHVPWMKPHQRLLEPSGLPGAAQRLELRDAASEALVTAGYQRIGIDHFALQDDALAQVARLGRLRRNFQGYTTDYAGTLIGFGASAIGSFAEGHAQNAARTDAWSAAIDAGRLATCRGIRTDDSDRRRGGIIERLMCGFEADLAADIAEEPGLADILDGLADLQRGRLVTRIGTHIRIPPEAHPFVRLVAARFDAYLAAAGSRHAAAV